MASDNLNTHLILTFESKSKSHLSLNRKWLSPISAPSSISDRTNITASTTNGSVAVKCSTRLDDRVLFHNLKYTTVHTTNVHATNSQRIRPNVSGSSETCSTFQLRKIKCLSQVLVKNTYKFEMYIIENLF